jgi:ribosomal protein L40E
MQPTKTHGICGLCYHPNPYTQTNCVRCGERLAWAFLIDGRKDSDFDAPLVKFFGRLFGRSNASVKGTAYCRYCEGPIHLDAKVCPHCHEWLVSRTPRGKTSGPLVDKDAPEIQRLLNL